MVKPATTKLSSRGQVMIPEEIRNRLGLEPGVQFVVVGEGGEGGEELRGRRRRRRPTLVRCVRTGRS
jgi:AbrB family looped-hinge helix DNA binding protein